MNTFKIALQKINGLKFLYEDLHFQSSVGRKKLLNQHFITDAALLKKELDLLEESLRFLQQENHAGVVNSVKMSLQQINDISTTIARLGQKQVLDDIELFEIKKCCLFTQQIMNQLQDSGFTAISLSDPEPVIDLLDPEKTRIPHFYIYSAYDSKLANFRKNIASAPDPERAENWRFESLKREDLIRADLAKKLLPYHSLLEENIQQIAQLDLLWAKAEQAIKFGFCKPIISTEKTAYRQLFNPNIKQILKEENKEYQPVDIDLYQNPSLITGANMSGKTVLLKTVALSQHLFQFGFYVPAKSARIVLVDEVAISIGDHHSEMNGLSSFAEEILTINKIIKKTRRGKKLLILVDELARTTNPEEGKALVNAFIRIMSEYNAMSLITSHYSGIVDSVRKLRVKGLRTEEITGEITPQTLNQYMDYSLVETDDKDVPHEALKIAEIFEVDEEFLALAKRLYTS